MKIKRYKTNILTKLWIQHLIWLIFCNILDCYRCIMFFVWCWLICREIFFCGRNKYERNKEEYFAKSISIMDIVKFFRWLLKALKVFHNWCTRGKSKSFEKHTKNELFELQILFYLWNILLYTFLHGMMNSFSFTICNMMTIQRGFTDTT